MFFWHFQNRHIANKQRLVIWLNGGWFSFFSMGRFQVWMLMMYHLVGPGCSSEDGALMEIGPYRVKDGSNGPLLEYNEGSWDEFANIMFVDNPVGTGYSFGMTSSLLGCLCGAEKNLGRANTN
jgi:carboxypeptidase D